MKHSVILLLIIFSACNSTNQEVKSTESFYDYDVEGRIQELGIELREPGVPIANYVNSVRSGNLVFLSGSGPRKADGTFITGKLGGDLTIDDGYAAARITAIEQLSSLKTQIGDLNKVVRIVKVLGMVNAVPSFSEQPAVINGFSDLMVEIFGERGKHARAAIGVGSLPMNIACEIEMIVEVE